MIFQFQTTNVNFFDEDKAYFETKLGALKKFLGSEAGDEDSVHVTVKLEKNKHSSGDRFESAAHVTCPHHGKFHAEVTAENIRACADLLEDKLAVQIKKFHEKNK